MAYDVGSEVIGPRGERFRLDRELGAGSFGKVYQATGVQSGETVAVKVAGGDAYYADPGRAKYALENEASAMLRVSHSNVVKVLHVESGASDGAEPYVIMELVEGGTLDELLDERHRDAKRFTLEEALDLMRPIAEGARAINSELVHRDMRPENVLVDRSGGGLVPKIADFGIAKVAGEGTRAAALTFKGTQAYRYKAPEVWRSESNTTKVDVYSVGLMFYEVLTLEHPLNAVVVDIFDMDRWREAHLTAPCPDVRGARPDVPLHIAELLARMTDKVPGNRPDWEAVLRNLVPKPPAASPREIAPDLLAVFAQHGEERFRERQASTAAHLVKERERERVDAYHAEYRESARRLLERFDEIVEAGNAHLGAHPIVIGPGRGMARAYTLTTGRVVEVDVFGPAPQPFRSSYGGVLGGGYIGVAGGLNANLALMGTREDVASARWVGVEYDVQATIAGMARLKLYREAGLDDATIAYLEYLDGRASWRRDAPTYFGFRSAQTFYEHFGQTGVHVYSYTMQQDAEATFSAVLGVALRMPRK